MITLKEIISLTKDNKLKNCRFTPSSFAYSDIYVNNHGVAYFNDSKEFLADLNDEQIRLIEFFTTYTYCSSNLTENKNGS